MSTVRRAWRAFMAQPTIDRVEDAIAFGCLLAILLVLAGGAWIMYGSDVCRV